MCKSAARRHKKPAKLIILHDISKSHPIPDGYCVSDIPHASGTSAGDRMKSPLSGHSDL